MREAKVYSHPMALSDRGSLGDEGTKDASKTRLDSLRLKVGQKFDYLFDFGDMGWHDIVVEEVGTSQAGSLSGVIQKRSRPPRPMPGLGFQPRREWTTNGN